MDQTDILFPHQHKEPFATSLSSLLLSLFFFLSFPVFFVFSERLNRFLGLVLCCFSAKENFASSSKFYQLLYQVLSPFLSIFLLWVCFIFSTIFPALSKVFLVLACSSSLVSLPPSQTAHKNRMFSYFLIFSVGFIPLFTSFTPLKQGTNYETCRKIDIPTPRWCQDIICGRGQRVMRYLHNFKVGGTYIQYIMRMYCPYYRFANEENCKHVRNPVKMKDHFLFTFVRDPVERYLSGYHEVMKWAGKRVRNSSEEVLSNIKGSKQPKMVKHNLYLQYVEKEMARTDKRYIDPHMAPQVGVLLNQGPLHLNYISNIANLSSKLSFLMWEVLGIKIRKGDGTFIRKKEDSRWAQPQFLVRKNELTESDLARIRRIYRPDYEVFIYSFISFFLSLSSLLLGKN